MPKKGDIIFFCRHIDAHQDRYNAGNYYDHIGIVTGFDGKTVSTIEGNTNGSVDGMVNEKYYNLDSSIIYSYGVWY